MVGVLVAMVRTLAQMERMAAAVVAVAVKDYHHSLPAWAGLVRQARAMMAAIAAM
jgi:hypothetical protein